MSERELEDSHEILYIEGHCNLLRAEAFISQLLAMIGDVRPRPLQGPTKRVIPLPVSDRAVASVETGECAGILSHEHNQLDTARHTKDSVKNECGTVRRMVLSDISNVASCPDYRNYSAIL